MIIVGLFTHFLADFVFQTKSIVESKRTKILLGNLVHSFIVLITYSIIFLIFNQFFFIKQVNLINIFLVILAISIIHFIIDVLKSLIVKINNFDPIVDLWMFLIDQILHIISVIVLFGLYYHYNYIDFIFGRMLLVITLYLMVIYIGDFTIRKTFKAIKNFDRKEEEIKGVGSLIGKIERVIIFTMLIIGHPEVIIAVIGIKSIARFPEFNKDEKNNDYFILGNLMSLLITILGYGLYYLIFFRGFYIK